MNHPVPYNSLPNTRPRISSPLTKQLTTQLQRTTNDETHRRQEQQPKQTAILFLLIIDALIFFNIAKAAAPHLQPHLMQSCKQLHIDTAQSPLPTQLIIPALVVIKSLSGFCLLTTGTTPLSYSTRSLLVYILLAGLGYISHQHATLLPLAILAPALCLILASITICLPLLRLTQVLVDLEDQQALLLQSSTAHRNPNKSGSYRRQSCDQRHSNKLLPQARYQHLRNPF